ncbi:hypothetical protein PGT21_025128 [Puccinia graminis f. sp. tritici]|uniref:Uncharacterized protein n=1 Tax=Puccinia graminis f. sp. tritici TaxID=56615 RepID=A0A5B0QPJ2_PUCGR|nr:hypothetical protein PGT21_025128 [Puccinia graminis f. sp. tritici]
MPDLPKPIPNPEPVRGLTGFFRICGVRVGTLVQSWNGWKTTPPFLSPPSSFSLPLRTPPFPIIPHSSFLLLPTISSAVTPSDSACHPSKACQSRYSSGRPWTGLPPPLPPLARSEPRFCPSVPPAPCSPSAVYAETPIPQSAVNSNVRQCLYSPQQAFQNLAHSACFSPLSRALES